MPPALPAPPRHHRDTPFICAALFFYLRFIFTLKAFFYCSLLCLFVPRRHLILLHSAILGFRQQRRPHLHRVQRRPPQPRRPALLRPEPEARHVDRRRCAPAAAQPGNKRSERAPRVPRACSVPQADSEIVTRSSRGVYNCQVSSMLICRFARASCDSRCRYVQRSFVAGDGLASVALPAVYDTAGHEERDANARYRLLLDIQDVFSTHSGLITSHTAGSKEHHDCFSGTSFLKWLRDQGGKHLTAHSIDFAHEGNNCLPCRRLLPTAPITGVVCQLAQEMLDERIMRALNDNPKFYASQVRLSVARSRLAVLLSSSAHAVLQPLGQP
jgi:hypothetical protein